MSDAMGRTMSGGAALLAAAFSIAIWGCSSSEKSEPDCVRPDAATARKQVKIERFGLGRAGQRDKSELDWCRACVMSDLGYASCQRVYAREKGEERESIRARARKKACRDAKLSEDECTAEKIISVLCKGDPPPEGTPSPSDALQNLYQALQGEGPAAPDAGSAESGEKP
ncbi:MAG: hypothetical protein R6V85_12450 [Polyangia bacterium]